MKTTIKELCEKWGAEYAPVFNLIKLLEEKGIANVVGKQKPKSESGRGKPSSIYELPEHLSINMVTGEISVGGVVAAAPKKAKKPKAAKTEPAEETAEPELDFSNELPVNDKSQQNSTDSDQETVAA